MKFATEIHCPHRINLNSFTFFLILPIILKITGWISRKFASVIKSPKSWFYDRIPAKPWTSASAVLCGYSQAELSWQTWTIPAKHYHVSIDAASMIAYTVHLQRDASAAVD